MNTFSLTINAVEYSNMMSTRHTFRLFKKRPSFLDGFASILDFSENKSRYNQSETGNDADVESVRSDWFAVGDDMWKAIDLYATELNRHAAQDTKLAE